MFVQAIEAGLRVIPGNAGHYSDAGWCPPQPRGGAINKVSDRHHEGSQVERAVPVADAYPGEGSLDKLYWLGQVRGCYELV